MARLELHNPASPVSDDQTRRLLVTNHAFVDAETCRTIVDIFLDDSEAPLARPDLT